MNIISFDKVERCDTKWQRASRDINLHIYYSYMVVATARIQLIASENNRLQHAIQPSLNILA